MTAADILPRTKFNTIADFYCEVDFRKGVYIDQCYISISGDFQPGLRFRTSTQAVLHYLRFYVIRSSKMQKERA